jgi:signal transduction histidine kinase
MTENKVRALLISAILVMSTVPPLGAFYFLDAAVQTSLNLGFNNRIERGLDIASGSLKALKKLDPKNEQLYRRQFEDVEDLQHIYAQPEWLKAQILGPIRVYFGIGLAALVLLAAIIASALSRKIRAAYRHIISELLAERERSRYLEQMASWQELARILAHEIKNPLTPVEVMVSSLGRAYREKSPDQFTKQLDETQKIVAEELSHLKRTVGRFSEFARLQDPTPEVLEAFEVINRHLPALRATFPDCGIAVRARSEARTARIRVDPSLFRQVLMNIVGNGVEANSGATIHFDIHIVCTPHRIRINVANDGAPVPASIAPRLFEPYVSEQRSQENMGLGLAIVKKIVVEHQGEIAYREKDGHPIFVIELPRVTLNVTAS